MIIAWFPQLLFFFFEFRLRIVHEFDYNDDHDDAKKTFLVSQNKFVVKVGRPKKRNIMKK
ncbi:hypothetical protein DERP_006885 [Dermatophagoides pteronyssinus]|uniref:Uncharacterized protein n=1 Tax=Dermatophagoides pteronyssinus TaxID=6956 RepID=A0ABQ8ISD2_DERPT|nr:hypothetical protein DERP_006885 [Dermatophagoides pteronyssinus]